MSTHRARSRRRATTTALALAAGACAGVIAIAAAAPGDALVGGYPVTGTDDAKGVVTSRAAGPDTRRVRIRYGPIHVAPGQNVNALALGLPGPGISGFVTRFAYNLEYPNGSIPGVDVIHLHHAVWMNGDSIFPGGEEKTVFTLPPGFGWAVQADAKWLLNHMIHNLTAAPTDVYLTWDMDVVGVDTSTARGMRGTRSIFMDVRNEEAYPVFDVLRGSGRHGRLAYPEQAPRAYADGTVRNRYTVPADGVLVAATGHVHPGGLFADLRLTRRGRTVPLFRSEARYWEPAGPVSWDMATTATSKNWKVAVRKGDVLSVSATYETRRASWYESMGIMTLAASPGAGGLDPFTGRIDRRGVLTHGRLPENGNHGGTRTGLPDARRLPDGPVLTAGQSVSIKDFVASQGDLARAGTPAGRPPVVRRGERLTFVNLDAKRDIFHSITSCKEPCNRATGVAYPLADGRKVFDSGELGFGPPLTTAAANVDRWRTPAALPPGTYTYFCRVHPFMRGSFRVR